MKRRLIAIIAFLGVATVCHPQDVMPLDAGFRPGQVLVKFKDSSAVGVNGAQGVMTRSGVSAVDKVMRQLDITECEQLMPLTGKEVSHVPARDFTGKEVTDHDMSKLFLLKSSNEGLDVIDAVEKLQALDEVEFAEPNYIRTVMSLQDNNDPMYSQQWGLQSANVTGMWSLMERTENVLGRRPVIAILDTGVDTEHPDLADNIWTNPKELAGEEGIDEDKNGFKDDIHGWDFVNQTGIIGDYNGHGTHCAGIAAAVGNNGIGIIGANPDALIMPVTVLQSNGGGDVATIVKGVDYAYANGADVISMSIGGYGYSIAEDQALSKAYSKCVLVAAAGNDGRCVTDTHTHCPCPMPCFPGAFTYVIGVMASDSFGSMAMFSNYDDDGPFFSEYNEERMYNYEVMAPGVQILSTYPGGRYMEMSGTSMACPLVAGIVSGLLEYKEINSNEIVFGDLIHSTGFLFKQYGGLIDAGLCFSFSDEDRKPNVHVVSFEINDSIGDGDGNWDAGETIDIYPVFRNEWGETMGDVKVNLSFADNEDKTLGEFLINDVDLGCMMSSYGKVKSLNPIRLKLRDNIVDGRVIRILATVSCSNMSEDYLPEEFLFKITNGVELGGIQDEDITLYPGIQYIVTKNWGIQKDHTVTVKAGTTIKIKDNVGISNYGNMLFEGTRDSMITITKGDNDLGNIGNFLNDNAKVVDFNYVIFDNFYNITFDNHRYNNCIIRNCTYPVGAWYFTQNAVFNGCEIYNNTVGHSVYPYLGWLSGGSTFIETSIHDNIFNQGFGSAGRFYKSNYIGNETYYGSSSPNVRTLEASNVFANYYDFWDYKGNEYYVPGFYSVVFETDEPERFYLSDAYLGTASAKVARQTILDYNDNIGWGEVVVDQMRDMASREAPLCVDYVLVDGMDPLDEADLMNPLGVGTHTIEVYFNRVMDQTVTPFITMGVRPPYTQVNLVENGHWETKYCYKATFTLNGKSATDGSNRIRVADYKALDQNPEFGAAIEKSRYNVNVSVAGSMSTGMMAEPGLGKVTLTWETDVEDFADLMGYNLYRYTMDSEETSSDTLMVNRMIIESDVRSFTDYGVVPGTTYYYYLMEIGTSLTENSVSKTVAATPLTSIKGDANGNMHVDIADVMTEVAYLSNEKPEPFIFEAADVNSDSLVNILDVVGTIKLITTPDAAAEGVGEMVMAYCYVQNGILYVESPVTIGGIQIRLKSGSEETLQPYESLKNFERLSVQMNDEDKIFLAYSMSGQVLSDATVKVLGVKSLSDISDVVLSTPLGQNIPVTLSDITEIRRIVDKTRHDNGIYDLNGRRIQSIPENGVVIMSGKKYVF